MLQVFKPQSAMSMGAWILALSGVCCSGLIALGFTISPVCCQLTNSRRRRRILIWFGGLWVLLATYTGVLIGATAIPT
jgi:hypothetical protein